MKKPRFIRRNYLKYSKLGRNRKKLQKWRGAKGMHSKIRKRRRGYPAKPLIGYATPRKESGKVQGLIPILVHNINELGKVSKNNIVIIAKVGAKKKIDLLKKADEMKIKVLNAGGKK